MRPMILKDIAQAIDMHESTISRVTSSKYMHTPRGVFELKYFFSSQVEAADGGGASSTAVRAKIRKLIKEEDTTNPLSDSRIAELLSAKASRSRAARSPNIERRWDLRPPTNARQKPPSYIDRFNGR
jgi:RNA polymerase sigma-54 factor